MSEPVDRDEKIADLLDHVQHNTDAARHCVVEIEPGQFVVTRTREQAVHLRGALAVLRAQLQPKPAEMLGANPNAPAPSAATVALDSEPVTDEADEPAEIPEPAAPAKRGPGRPRKAAPQPGG